MLNDPSPSEAIRVFISYSHDSDDHKRNILGLAQDLRRQGIDAQIDQFVEANPPLDWARWMRDQISESAYVLLVFTEQYARRFLGRETPGRGYGVRWEGAIVTGDLYYSDRENVKFIPVVVEAADNHLIPSPLSLTSRYTIGRPNDRNLVPLLRHLLNKPAVVPEPLGEVPIDFGDTDTPGFDVLSQAKHLLAAGETREAIKILTASVDAPDRKVAARAAFTLGCVLEDDEQFLAAVSAFRRTLTFGPRSGVADEAFERLQALLAIMGSHFGEGSAVDTAHRWLEAVKDGRMEDVWKGLDRQTRLVLAQAWILANERHPRLRGVDREEVAQDLSLPEPQHWLREDFFSTQLNEFQVAYAGYDPDTWGAAERPRPFELDYEVVLLTEVGGDPFVWQPNTQVSGIVLILRWQVGEWRVAGFGLEIPIPGWPPTRRAVDSSIVNLTEHRQPPLAEDSQ
ncbi:SEFIR domain-containing protein [Micromonospora sp. NPDC049048]|uniref:SEFIR domain-containing protein n=1 Tax=Micromonospora sp. NPDC049048 TaxID=3364263 RepID=UPI003710E70B